MPATKSAEVLLKLLEKVPDSKKLSKLLEPENLLALLQSRGKSQDELRKRLQSGTIPGELLLELLDEEPDADRLLEQLRTSEIKPASRLNIPAEPLNLSFIKSRTTPETVSAAPAREFKGIAKLLDKYHPVAVIAIFSLTAVIPALAILGFLSPITPPANDTATVLALVGGAIGGAIANPFQSFSWRGAVTGMVYGVSTLWATIAYTQARTSIFKFEIVIPLALGAIPAFGVYFLLTRLFRTEQL